MVLAPLVQIYITTREYDFCFWLILVIINLNISIRISRNYFHSIIRLALEFISRRQLFTVVVGFWNHSGAVHRMKLKCLIIYIIVLLNVCYCINYNTKIIFMIISAYTLYSLGKHCNVGEVIGISKLNRHIKPLSLRLDR